MRTARLARDGTPLSTPLKRPLARPLVPVDSESDVCVRLEVLAVDVSWHSDGAVALRSRKGDIRDPQLLGFVSFDRLADQRRSPEFGLSSPTAARRLDH
jgi:hypothetical protein